MLARSLLSLALVSCILVHPATAGEVWTVAAASADFTQVQPAVDAAVDGDIVLVYAGTYEQFAIFDKSLTVLAEAPGAVQIDGQVRVQDLASGRVVSLIDLEVSGNGERALFLAGSQGSIRVRGGSYAGTDDTHWYMQFNSGIEVASCADVSLRSLQISGGEGADVTASPLSAPSNGGAAIRSVDSKLAVHHCTASGGNGGSDVVGEAYDGGHGGHGLEVQGGYLYVANSSFVGGNGGNGGEEDGVLFPKDAGNGGDGGDGIRLAAGAHGDLLAATATGGLGGAGGWGYTLPDGSPGQSGLGLNLIGGATSNDLGGTVRRLAVDAVLSAGSPHTIQLFGQPGESALLFFNKRTKFAFSLNNLGVWLVGGLPIGVHVGQLDATGSLTLHTTAPNLAPSADGTTMQFQALLGGNGAGRYLTGSNVSVVLQPGY